jgi:hypothetical protein
LWAGWHLDDYLLQLQMENLSILDSRPLSPFVFSRGEPELNDYYTDQGVFPYWTAPNFQLAFFRPLTALTHNIDILLWKESATMMHLHNILWFVGLVLAAGHLFRTISDTNMVGGLAALFYGVSVAHAIPAAWIASRHVLISSFFGILLRVMWHQAKRQSMEEGIRPDGGLSLTQSSLE